MKIMEWFFDGLGTEIVSLLIGGILGGVIGYKIGISQKAGKNSRQVQAKNSIVAGRDITAGGNIKVEDNDKNNR